MHMVSGKSGGVGAGNIVRLHFFGSSLSSTSLFCVEYRTGL